MKKKKFCTQPSSRSSLKFYIMTIEVKASIRRLILEINANFEKI